MEKLDEILNLDFTIDAAHALRSDCLAATSQESAARIESDIADGLIHSLMDSGDGESVKTVYFDVSSFVKGRKSRMAAIDTLASSMP